MEKVEQKFVDFMLNKSPKPIFAQWIEEIAQQYSERLMCPLCGNENIDIIVVPKVFIRCEACHTRNEFSIDKIQPTDYNTVIFSHEDKVRQILRAQELK